MSHSAAAARDASVPAVFVIICRVIGLDRRTCVAYHARDDTYNVSETVARSSSRLDGIFRRDTFGHSLLSVLFRIVAFSINSGRDACLSDENAPQTVGRLEPASRHKPLDRQARLFEQHPNMLDAGASDEFSRCVACRALERAAEVANTHPRFIGQNTCR
jgi:hypothetical protein